MTADLLASSVGNPQSLNRYAYVMNNPASLVDELELKEKPIFERPPDPDLLSGNPAWWIGGGISSILSFFESSAENLPGHGNDPVFFAEMRYDQSMEGLAFANFINA